LKERFARFTAKTEGEFNAAIVMRLKGMDGDGGEPVVRVATDLSQASQPGGAT
jgi:hypothetical protein